jgi:hypothetical protein
MMEQDTGVPVETACVDNLLSQEAYNKFLRAWQGIKGLWSCEKCIDTTT